MSPITSSINLPILPSVIKNRVTKFVGGIWPGELYDLETIIRKNPDIIKAYQIWADAYPNIVKDVDTLNTIDSMITNLKNELSVETDTTEKISTYIQPLLQDPELRQLAEDIERLNLNCTNLGDVINKNKKILFDETKIKLVVPFLLRLDDDHLTLLPGKIIEGLLPVALSKELVDSMSYIQLYAAISNTVKNGYINFRSFEMDLPFLIALTKTDLGCITGI